MANKLMVERPSELPAEIAADPAKVQELEEEFSSNIPAGYMYFGQFVDHDIAFDPASSLMRRNDPNGLLNFRTPRLDLDNVYGRGPDDQPYLYDQQDKAKLAVGKVAPDPAQTQFNDLPDLPRIGDRAIIGDMRNDEHAIVSQLQLAFLLAHNTLVDRARANDPGADTGTVFERARRTLRWLYQHIVWNDFVERIIINDIHADALKRVTAFDGRTTWEAGLGDVHAWKHQPFMPVEFSVAAYRFGHSMVRNAYQTNNPARGFADPSGNRIFVPIFDNTPGGGTDDLRGFRPMSPKKNSIQWDWFLPMLSSVSPFPQMARKIDTKLSNALSFLFEGAAGDPLNVLAFQNLLQGQSFDLPSGTSVARKWCLKPLTLKGATGDMPAEPDALWYYILREAQGNGGNTLGRVGSVIIGAVFAGLLKSDPCSYINMAPCWTPDEEPLLRSGDPDPSKNDNRDDASWTLASIIRIAGLKADGAELETGALCTML